MRAQAEALADVVDQGGPENVLNGDITVELIEFATAWRFPLGAPGSRTDFPNLALAPYFRNDLDFTRYEAWLKDIGKRQSTIRLYVHSIRRALSCFVFSDDGASVVEKVLALHKHGKLVELFRTQLYSPEYPWTVALKNALGLFFEMLTNMGVMNN